MLRERADGAVLAYAAAKHVDVGTLVLAAFGALLHRCTSTPELVLCGAAGPLWVDTEGDPSFAELVRRVHCEFAAEAISPSGVHEGRLQVAFAAGAVGPSCDLEVTLEERLEGSVAVAAFERDVLDEAAVARFLSRLAVVLAAAIDDPERTIGELGLLTPEERARILVEWNDTARPFPDCRADELIAAQSRVHADDVAVEFEDYRLTYRELDARANGLARLLQELGVGPDVLVAICVDRSLDMLVGLLGIMRAGGAYVPVDPAFPADRRRFMLEDAAVPVVVTQESLLPQLDAHGRARGLPRPGRGADRRCGGDGAAVRGHRRLPGLRHLHVRLDGEAEGRRDPASRARQLPHDDGPRAGPHRRRCARRGDDALVRHRGPRALPAARDGGARRDRPAGGRRGPAPARRPDRAIRGDGRAGDADDLAHARRLRTGPGGLA